MKGLKNLFRWVRPYWLELVIILIIVIIVNSLYSYIPNLISYAFYFLGSDKDTVPLPSWFKDIILGGNSTINKVVMVAVAIIALQLIRQILNFLNGYVKGHFSESIKRDMRVSLYDHVADLSFSYHKNSDTGDLIQRCTSDVTTSCNFVAGQLPQFVSIITFLIIGSYQLYMINVYLMIAGLSLVPISIIMSAFYLKYVSKRFKVIEETESEMTTCIQENANGVRVVKAFNQEIYEYEKMDKVSKHFKDSQIDFNKRMAVFWGISDALGTIQYLIVIVVGVLLAKQGIVTTANIVACLLLTGMVTGPIRGLGRIISDYGKASVAANRIDHILNEPSEYIVNGKEKPAITGNISFKNVSFKFDDEEKHLLDDISFNIKAGSTVAIVGPTGSGKSTICNLLTRMLEYQSGHIILDGVEIKDIDKQYLRSQIRMLLQEPFLYSASVYDNIAVINPEISKDDLYKYSKIAALHDEVLSFEQGYNTIVGERGATLSGGQRQRVAIARVLLSGSPVIIFDDSLSALDTKTDSEVRKALETLDNKTTKIIITHRTTTSKDADQIIVLNHGKIENIGTHDELIKRDGIYKELWDIQGALFDEFSDKEVSK